MRRVEGLLSLASWSLLASCGTGETSEPLQLDDAADASFDAGFDSGSDTFVADEGIDSGRDTAPETSGYDATPPPPPPYDVAAPKRGKCLFTAGDTTLATIGPDVPHGDKLPFDHIVVLIMENRSFDAHWSKLPRYGVTDVDVADPSVTNPDSTGPDVKRFHETRYCTVDNAHDWGPVHTQYNGGKMDGFVQTSNPGGARTMGYYDETDLPFYYWMARTYAISDRHFSGCLGPTWPNRFFFYGATAYGRTKTPDTPPLGKTQILNHLEDAGHTWKIYRDGITSFADVFGPKYLGTSMSNFEDDVAKGDLPDLTMIDPDFSGSTQNDEHPPSNVQLGQQFVARVVKALGSNPKIWKSTVLFVTYDEHGGYYDHVPPPAACVPDDDAPPTEAYDRYGIRVPLTVISRFAKPHYVSHYVTDHSSITRFIENRFDLGAMTKRDANAWPMLDMFDFEKPPFDSPDASYPSADASADGIDWCKTHAPGTGLP